MANEQTSAPCRCGQVEFRVEGAPILRAICYCASCQQAGRLYQAIPAFAPVLAEDGGTDYVLYRKDRIRCVQGGDLLEERRLNSSSPTRRMHARCCGTPMYCDFTKGHWLSVYRGRISADVPPPIMRVMTAARPEGVALSDDIPNYPGYSAQFILKLLRTWIAMGFRRPAVKGVP